MARGRRCCAGVRSALAQGKKGRGAVDSGVRGDLRTIPRQDRSADSQTVLRAKKECGRTDLLPPSNRPSCLGSYFLLTAFLSSAPGVNFATLRAAILIVAPVCGLRPLRAFLCETENVPNPINATRSPFLRAAVMLSTAVSIAVVACVLVMSQAPAIRSTRSALFIVSPRQNSVSAPASLGEVQPLLRRNPDGCYSPPRMCIVNAKIQ